MTSNAYGLRLLAKPGVQITILALLATLVLAFRLLQFIGLTRQIQWGYDFSAYWTAAARLLAGVSPYTAEQLAGPYAPQVQYLYLYPPPLAAIVTPLAALFPTDYRAAAWVWTAIGAAILFWAVLALWRSERLAERFPILSGGGRWLLVAGAFVFPPVVGELVLGNVHLLLLGLLTVAWLGIRRGDSKGELTAGIAVGLAAVIKVFPAVLLIWFVLTRRYRAAAGVVIGAAAFALITLPVTGVEPWTQFPAVLANLSAPSDTTDTLAPTVWLAGPLGFTPARILVTLVGLGLIAWTAWTVRRTTAGQPGSPVGSPEAARLARSFAIAATVSVLIAPALYHHYLALLVLPLVLGLATGVPLRWLVLAYLLMWGGQQNALGDLSWVLNRGLPTIGALVVLAALLLPPRAQSRSTTQTTG